MNNVGIFWGSNYDWTTGRKGSRTKNKIAFEKKLFKIKEAVEVIEVMCPDGTLYCSPSFLNLLKESGGLKDVKTYQGDYICRRYFPSGENYMSALAKMGAEIHGEFI